jgi:hypothetical protein
MRRETLTQCIIKRAATAECCDAGMAPCHKVLMTCVQRSKTRGMPSGATCGTPTCSGDWKSGCTQRTATRTGDDAASTSDNAVDNDIGDNNPAAIVEFESAFKSPCSAMNRSKHCNPACHTAGLTVIPIESHFSRAMMISAISCAISAVTLESAFANSKIQKIIGERHIFAKINKTRGTI